MMIDAPVEIDDVPPFDAFLCFAVYSANLSFSRAYKPLLERLGLTYPQYLVMVALAARDGQAVSELGETLFLESNTLTPLLKRLEAVGTIDRKRDRIDERIVRIWLTDQGRKIAAEAESVPARIMEATGFDRAELRAMQKLMERLRDNLRS